MNHFRLDAEEEASGFKSFGGFGFFQPGSARFARMLAQWRAFASPRIFRMFS